MTQPSEIPAVSDKTMANAIRALAMDAVQQANSGHPGMPMGMADAAYVLFSDFLKFDPKHPNWPDRDRFVLSAGHGSMLQYALMYLTGYEDMTLEEIKNFRQLGAKTAGHPEYGHAEGIETTTGPLGQGIANAVGMALAERMLNARFGNDVVDHYTYVIAGDGCLMEGISHEAASLAGHLKLNKLIVLWDDNEISIDGPTSLSVSDDVKKRFESYGWAVQTVRDGHDIGEVYSALAAAKTAHAPTLIACKTEIGYGAPTKAGTAGCHGSPLGDDEIAGARKNLGWNHAPFEIPQDVLSAWRTIGEKGGKHYKDWSEKFDASKHKKHFEQLMSGHLPDGWQQSLESFKQELAKSQPNEATRKSSENVLNVLTAAIPEMVGGSADLTGSNNTKTKAMKGVQADNYGGQYIYYGVREHAMGAVMNGMALHKGFIPYGGTFMVFTDYCRPAIRLSALMQQRIIYVMTHDSIGLGEDGPTHQPVEHLASLRAMPNVNVFRPADATETAECWALAVSNQQTPSILSLTRQNVPHARTEYNKENLCARGGYVLRESPVAGRQSPVTLIATGSEVSIALEAQEKLKAKNIPARVVSLPCWELFDAQPQSYRKQVLGEGLKVAIEAAGGFGWERYIGEGGIFIGMTGFGASAPAPDLYKHFGITADNVVSKVESRL
ncbi:MAG: transketolase [Alphaproteobacteria bacterium]